jgi:serine protease Do
MKILSRGANTMKSRLRKLSIISLTVLIVLIINGIPATGAEDTIKKMNESLIKITRKAMPMVVNISAVKAVQKTKIIIPFSPQPQPFDHPFQPPQKPQAAGSGVIVDKKGYIITNNHVIRDARAIKVTLSDKREFSCAVVGTDPATDIAVIKITGNVPDDLPVIKMGNSDEISVGEIVIAIGNPFGFTHTVTMGIISATGRQDIGLVNYENYIQTDAAINPGNSGGALININGEMIGMNTAIYSKSGGYMGIGFSIPSNMLRQIVDELIKSGKVVRGWLGVYIQKVTKELADSFKLGSDAGALVSDIMKDSPAYGSGIKTGDIITAVDGTAIVDVNHLRKIVAVKKPGTDVTITIFRNGNTMDISMKVGTLPEGPVNIRKEVPGKEDTLGLIIKDIDEETAYRFKIIDKQGVVIISIRVNSPAYNSGLMLGDVVKEIERKPIDSVRSYLDAITESKDKPSILFLVKRAGTNRFMVIEKVQK